MWPRCVSHPTNHRQHTWQMFQYLLHLWLKPHVNHAVRLQERKETLAVPGPLSSPQPVLPHPAQHRCTGLAQDNGSLWRARTCTVTPGYWVVTNRECLPTKHINEPPGGCDHNLTAQSQLEALVFSRQPTNHRHCPNTKRTSKLLCLLLNLGQGEESGGYGGKHSGVGSPAEQAPSWVPG